MSWLSENKLKENVAKTYVGLVCRLESLFFSFCLTMLVEMWISQLIKDKCIPFGPVRWPFEVSRARRHPRWLDCRKGH